MRAALACLTLVAAVAFGAADLRARQMPDPKQVAGIPLPVANLPTGTISVRVIKGSLTNNIPDQLVELKGVDPARSVKTDAGGRAQFDGLTPGARVTATTTVGSELLQSQEITVPASGGIRVLLVATDPDAEKKAAEDQKVAGPAQPGVIVLGDQSRFVIELGDGSLSVFNILQIVNAAGTPVQPAQPLIFELPRESTGASILQDSSPQAKADGKRVSVAGPFAPGTTLVQFAYSMPYSGGDLDFEQTMPVSLARVIILAQKVGEMRLQSPQMSEQREMAAEGQSYIVGQGPAIGAGRALSLTFSGLPHEPRWPHMLALGLAVVVLIVGAWASLRTPPEREDKTRTRLETKRGQLFAELTALEEQHRDGGLTAERYTSRRQELIASLERVYAEIDRRAA
jgi:hypothetical protein